MPRATSTLTTNAARNQQVLREVNRRVRQVGERFSGRGAMDFLCECGEADCLETVALTVAEFDLIAARRAEVLTALSHRKDDPLVRSTA
jgi:hypothetical protein